jgi:riboflavin biosynthesis pyrimidine reductase
VPLDNPVFRDDGNQVIRVVDAHTPTHAWPAHIDVLAWPISDEGLDPRALVTALQAQGLKRLLVEGGPTTLSAFIQASVLDYVYAMVAPLIIGSGPTGWVMPEIDHLDQAVRVPMRSTPLDDELLIELDFASLDRGGASSPT